MASLSLLQHPYDDDEEDAVESHLQTHQSCPLHNDMKSDQVFALDQDQPFFKQKQQN